MVDNGESAATVEELRAALRQAERALMHAEKRTTGNTWVLVHDALGVVSGTLDIGRDERNEQVAT